MVNGAGRLSPYPVCVWLRRTCTVGSGVSLVVSVLWGCTVEGLVARRFFVFEGCIGSDDFFSGLDGGSQ